jgi:hypothetical protein
MYSDVLKAKRTLGWRTLLIVPELEPEVERLSEMHLSRLEEQSLRHERSGADLELRELELNRLDLTRGGEVAGGGEVAAALAEIDARHAEVERERGTLAARLAELISQRHAQFHPQWGQLFKSGHQNSRWAQQVEDYACLYTSHATNLAYATGSTHFRALSDLMPHDRLCIDAAAEDACEVAS